MPILTLTDVGLSFGTDVILDRANLTFEKGDRVCLSGRNGSGKSTLLKVILGEQTPDSGQVWRQNGLVFANLEQTLPRQRDLTVFKAVAMAFEDIGELLDEYEQLLHNLDTDGAMERLDRLQHAIEARDGWSIKHRIDTVLDKLGLEPDKSLQTLSGGWRKRVSIAKSLVLDPDVWILDEPTNHLDIPTIQWLEEVMLDFQGSIIFVSHDRQLMQSVAKSVIEIDRGNVTRWDCDYAAFIERRDHEREVEQQQNKLFDQKLAKEEVWIRQGIKARRTRNEGRVRDLEALRRERAQRREHQSLKLEIGASSESGKIVKEVTGLTKRYGAETVVRDFDFVIQRKDRIGLIGPNGAGKSTLLKLLLEEESPDAGEVKTGTRLSLAYFDQAREQLPPEKSVSDYISDGRDYISIGGKEVHVVSYLSNFMFNADQARAPIRTLSGGEQNRLLLARLFSLPANLLVLDEPTNDLDVETLELLEERLADYDGTVLIVSHDRSFMDNVVTNLLVFKGQGHIEEFVGGYSDWLRETGGFEALTIEKERAASKPAVAFQNQKKQKSEQRKLEKELQGLPEKIEKLEANIEAIHEEMADPGFFQQSAQDQQPLRNKLAAAEADLETLLARWEELESLV